MTNVYLYGQLRNKFGDHFKFKINSPKEAFSAINANRKGFLDEIKKLYAKGVFYRIVIDDEVINHAKELEVAKAPKEIHLMPVIWGAGRNGAGIALILAAIVIAVASQGTAAPVSSELASVAGADAAAAATAATAANTTGMMIAASLAISGVMMLLFSPPKPDFNQEVSAGGKSYLFGQRSNNTSQGQAVPVGYGRLLIGSSQISAGVNHYTLSTDIKSKIAPVDKPIDDYVDLFFENETSSAGLTVQNFSTNQAANVNDNINYSSINILNSYISILTLAVAKLTSDAVEVVVKTNGEVVSNPNLSTFNEDIEYSWEVQRESNPGKIWIENTYSFKPGLAYRAYQIPNFDIYTNSEVSKTNTSVNFFASYAVDSLVKWGPNQFISLLKPNWDYNYSYVFGELITFNSKVYKAIASSVGKSPLTMAFTSAAYTYATKIVTIVCASSHGISSGDLVLFSGIVYNPSSPAGNPDPNGQRKVTKINDTTLTFPLDTGENANQTYTLSSPSFYRINANSTVGTLNSTYWLEIVTPKVENVYKVIATSVGYLPTEADPATPSIKWALISAPASEAAFNTLTNLYPSFNVDQGVWPVFSNPSPVVLSKTLFEKVNLPMIKGNTSNIDNYMMEFFGYFYVPRVENRIVSAIDSLSGTMYEIVKVGRAAQWTNLGLAAGITPRAGITFTRNSNDPTLADDGLVYPVSSYKFRLNSDDASDLYIDGQLASYYYGSHGFDGPSNSTPVVLKLTSGYHRLYGRFQDEEGLDGMSIYYQYDSNNDGIYSDLVLASFAELSYRSVTDINLPLKDKYLSKKVTITSNKMVSGRKYKILDIGSGIDWTSLGASSAVVGTVFYKNSTTTSNTSGIVTEDLFSYYQSKDANSQRIVTFTSQRPSENGLPNAGLSYYHADFVCTAKIKNKTLLSSPVKTRIRFLPTKTTLDAGYAAIAPIAARQML